MTRDTRTKAQRNRAIRQEALREQLAAGGHLQHVIDMANKMADVAVDMDSIEIQRLRAAMDVKLKLVDKYLPSLKAVEVTGEEGGAIMVTKVERVIVDPKERSS